jgi:hypothetical protein
VPILTRPGTNHSWGEEIQFCPNERERPSPKGDNSKRVKYTEFFLKSSSPEPARQIQSSLVQTILG